MKKTFAALSLLLCMSFAPVKKNRIVFFGDSITQAGVNEGGYITRLKKMMPADAELIGAGIGGNKVYDLYLRMEDDVISSKPDAVVIYVGINDVWHKTTSGTGTDRDKYEKFYMAIIKKLQAKNIKVFVCTPTVIGEKKQDANPQDADLNAYSEIVRKVATATGSTLIDLRAAFRSYLLANNPDDKESGILTTDRVHLTEKGNQLVADEMLKALK